MKFVIIFTLAFLSTLNAARDVNDKTLNLIKDYEKWKPCTYIDAVGKPTIGYGHLIRSGDGFNKKSCITKERGNQVLKDDLSTATKAIERAVKVPLNDNQFGALVSWAFNVGGGAAAQSTLVKKLNSGSQTSEILNEFRRWNKGNGKVLPGLSRRREDECSLFSSK